LHQYACCSYRLGMLDWLIMGGGPHGTHLGIVLAQLHGVENVAIVDPHDQPLQRWWQCVENTGMKHLRSPIVHHLGLSPWDLRDHARQHGFDPKDHLFPPYDRPSVELFRSHCEVLEERHQLEKMRVLGKVKHVSIRPYAVVATTEGGILEARNAVLAIGSGDNLHRPAWASQLLLGGARVHHLFEVGFDLSSVQPDERVAVVGGGISAAQCATSLTDRGCRVTLIRRHEPRVHTFDSEPGWVGPKYMKAFLAQRDPVQRRRAIQQARHRGSMTEEAARDLDRAVRTGRCQVLQADVESVSTGPRGLIGLNFGNDLLVVDRVLLATGLVQHRPGGALIDQLIDEHTLPCAACGFPVLSHTLRWHERLYVCGPLAELELGPVARNLVGARRAAERLALVTSAP
jgi:hypothetical protein